MNPGVKKVDEEAIKDEKSNGGQTERWPKRGKSLKRKKN